MKTPINRFIIVPLLAIGLGSIGCSSFKGGGAEKQESTRVSLSQLSSPARATVQKLTAGGQIDDVEATVGGKHVEYTIAEADGAVLGTETSIEFSQLPEPVRMAAQKYFGGSTGLKAMKGVEDGKTSYEIEGPKNGKTVEVTFDPNGKRQ